MPNISLASKPEPARAKPSRKKFGGLLTREERWHLSLRGWLLLLCVITGAGWLTLLNAFSFLAINQPVDSDVLVVEGWMTNWAIQIAAEEFKHGAYKMVCSTGGPVPGSGGYTNDFNTVASVGAERLIGLGIPRELVHTVPSREAARDRTFASAVVLKQWFREQGMDVRAINVMTETTHARRTLLLFQAAMGPEIKVGVIALMNPDFNPDKWWQYSEGVRDVIGESLAYLYAKVFFWRR